MDAVHIGTSGYSYDHWKGVFYPENLPRENYLQFYIQHFDTVEINYSFYHIPAEVTVKKWAELAPTDFLFTLKAYRKITHEAQLQGVEGLTKVLLWRARLLGKKMGVVLFQLPPSFPVDLEKLQAYLQILPKSIKCAFEFRNDLWVNNETFALLRRYQVGYCVVSAPHLSCRLESTANFVYIRLHGRDRWINYNYSEEELLWWRERINEFSKQGKEVFVYFNNDVKGYAVKNALRLKEIINEK